MDTVSFQTNALPMIFPKHNSIGFFWYVANNNFFYWCSFALHKIFAVGRHTVQVLECKMEQKIASLHGSKNYQQDSNTLQNPQQL